MTLQKIARLVGGELSGNPEVRITSLSGIREARPGDLTFIANPKYREFLRTTRASAVIVGLEESSSYIPLIRVREPYLAYQRVAETFYVMKHPVAKGVHSAAIVAESARIGKDSAIGPYVVVEEGAEIREEAILYPFVYIGRKAKVGKGSILYPQVSVREECEVGKRCILHSGTVIGSDGFGFATDREGVHHKIPQVGRVILEDDVEIGANTAVDRATLGATVIKSGTKIDNLVQVAHNVVIGKGCLLAGQVGISGSTEIGDNVAIGGQAGLVGHIEIGDRAVIGASAGVTKSVLPGITVSGYPARPHAEAKRREAAALRMPEALKKIAELERRLETLEKKLKPQRKRG
jgi:UDP-3-O-[3-hydroxymyristoyl] glucosamine N-acyltransferase